MRTGKCLLLILAYAFCFGCDADYVGDTELDFVTNEGDDMEIMHKIDIDNALYIASSFFEKMNTRTSAVDDYLSVDYVVSELNKTRTNNMCNDTVAYIFNRGQHDGFVIVASDNRVKPILAYSDEGHFDYTTNDMVYTEFISLIGEYIERNSNHLAYTYDNSLWDGCVSPQPLVQTSWGQESPFDKYVIKEHPGCPAGCVAVAAGIVMSYSKPRFTYHDITFYLRDMVKGLAKESSSGSDNVFAAKIIGGYTKNYTYEEAADYAAQLLYWIGKDVGMEYSVIGSSAFSTLAYRLIKNQGFDVKHNGLVSYNIDDIIDFLEQDCIVYMRGRDSKRESGHAWVVDGYCYCYGSDNVERINEFLHCDWGWFGLCNGYFSGDVFSNGYYDFGGKTYFAVGIEPGV